MKMFSSAWHGSLASSDVNDDAQTEVELQWRNHCNYVGSLHSINPTLVPYFTFNPNLVPYFTECHQLPGLSRPTLKNLGFLGFF